MANFISNMLNSLSLRGNWPLRKRTLYLILENVSLSCTEECQHCDRNAHCVGGHCICKHGFVGDGLDCWGKKETSSDRLDF